VGVVELLKLPEEVFCGRDANGKTKMKLVGGREEKDEITSPYFTA
jgi:hypothetical protein